MPLHFCSYGKMVLPVRDHSCAPILQPRIALLHHLPFSARSQAPPRRIKVMAQQTQTSPQEHPHTDPRTNEPSEQTPFSTKDGENQQEYPGQEKLMNPKPDFGYETYKGCGRLKGKKALVTGADSGIGRAVALAYAREGADVAISYLSEHEDAELTKKVVEEAGQKAILLPGGLEDEEHIKSVVAKTVEEFGQIDILVNNASYQGEAVEDFTQISRDRLEHTFAVNIIGMISLAQKVVEHMPAGGSIINTASIQAVKPNPTILDYACTKGAIVTMTKCLAKELVKSRGIRVNSVAPGPVWTPLIAESFPAEKVETFGRGQTPTDRAGQPAELAPPFVFLANNAESSYVNGEIMNVTGGMEMG